MSGPTWKCRAGSVSVAIWDNETPVNGKTVVIRKATLERRYTDKDGNWKSSNSFGRNEIPMALYCLSKAFSRIVEGAPEDEEKTL